MIILSRDETIPSLGPLTYTKQQAFFSIQKHRLGFSHVSLKEWWNNLSDADQLNLIQAYQDQHIHGDHVQTATADEHERDLLSLLCQMTEPGVHPIEGYEALVEIWFNLVVHFTGGRPKPVRLWHRVVKIETMKRYFAGELGSVNETSPDQLLLEKQELERLLAEQERVNRENQSI